MYLLLHRLLIVAAGGFLVTAALLKSLDAEPSDLSIFETLDWNRFRPILIGWELFLGVWLLSGEMRFWAAISGAVTFALFAVVAGFSGWVGQASCQCFGTVPTNPWLMSGIDIGLLIGLLLTASWKKQAGDATRVADLLRVALVGLPLSLLFVLGIPAEVAARIRGEAFRVDESRLDMGDANPGDVLIHEVSVLNVSGSPQRLVGGSQDCSCRVTGLSAQVGPKERSTITIKIRVPADTGPGRFRRPVDVYTDVPAQPIIRLNVSCRVR